ncbi:MAG: CarD family transcriptional regulator [Deltaproteobacteria bacterium]|nr:CarD family transcriptional regulator [Deltaproteobacteria bacterium]
MTEVEFKIGDLAVYPAQGVAEIVGIETRRIGALQEIFYTLRILDSEKKIMIPVKKVGSVGLRRVVSRPEAEDLVALMAGRMERADAHETWNRRYRRYLEKIKSGQAPEVAEVFRDLSVIKIGKELSFGERKMLDMARTLLVKELAIALGIDETAMEARLDELFGPDPAEADGEAAAGPGPGD